MQGGLSHFSFNSFCGILCEEEACLILKKILQAQRVNLSSAEPWNLLSYFLCGHLRKKWFDLKISSNRFIAPCFVLKDNYINTSVCGILCQRSALMSGSSPHQPVLSSFLILEWNFSPDFQCKCRRYQSLMIKVTSVQISGASNGGDAFDLHVTFHS